MSALAKLPGDPGLIHETAEALAAAGEQLGALTDVCYGLREATWDSPAGQQFAARVAGPPRVFSALARRYGLAAQALHAYADAFAAAQARSAHAAERFDRACDTLAVLAPQVGAAADPFEGARRQAQYAAWDRARTDAESSWYAALHEYRAADARCAALLEAASHDELTDSWQYTALHTAQREGARVSAVGMAPTPWTKAVGAIAGGISTAAMVADKVIYGEGSWRQIGGNAALSAVGSGGRALTYAARAGVPALGPAERLGLGSRLVRGAQAETRDKLTAWRPSSHVGPAGPGVTVPRAGRHARRPNPLSDTTIVRWGQQANRRGSAALVAGRDVAVKTVEQRYLVDYRLALRAGPEAQKLLYAGWGVQSALKTSEAVGRVRAWRTVRDDDPS